LAAAHAAVLQRLVTALQGAAAGSGTDRVPQPLEQYVVEQTVRTHVVAFDAWVGDLGYDHGETVRRLGLAPRTLRAWRQEVHDLALVPRLGGRPRSKATVKQSRRVRAYLTEEGPGLGLPSLQEEFPELARAELRRLLTAFRREWRAEHPEWVSVLHWLVPGTVWAMDLAQAAQPIDGWARYLFAVRELGSGKQLAWLPVADLTAVPVIAALEELFRRLGAPLVLKSDNGSAFIDQRTQRLLGRWQVWPLYSPPACPAYNGACEAAIRWLTAWTAAAAVERGAEAGWTAADVAAALHHANTHVRAWRGHGPTREDVWQRRLPVPERLRKAFGTMVEPEVGVSIDELGHDAAAVLRGRGGRACLREALERALVAHDLLQVSRRRIPPRVLPKKVATRG
jgi:hypothetical protein